MASGLTPVVLANTRELLEAIRDHEADADRSQAHFLNSGETRARQGITSDEMLNAWRIALEVVRERAHARAEELGIGKDVLLEFVVAALWWGDIGMRASASAHHEAEIRQLGRPRTSSTSVTASPYLLAADSSCSRAAP